MPSTPDGKYDEIAAGRIRNLDIRVGVYAGSVTGWDNTNTEVGMLVNRLTAAGFVVEFEMGD